MIVSALCVYATIWFVEQKEKVQWICESQNVKAQMFLTDAMGKLLSLNPSIESTVTEKKWVQRALRLDPEPATRAALQLRLLLLKMRLVQLAASQQLTLQSAHMRSGAEISSLRKNLQAQVSEMENQWGTRLFLEISTSSPRLKLRKKKIDTGAHLYLEHPELERQQRVDVRIAITGAQLFPRWLEWLTSKPLLWTESCSSKPEKKEAEWYATLSLDRF